MGHIIVIAIAVMGFIIYMKGKRNTESPTEAFWERENEANSVRRKPLDNLDYITIPIDLLPMLKNTTDELLLEDQEKIISLSQKTIVNLTGISNTDLKLEYGAPNLTILTEYDQNFILLARTLNSWGHRLYELGMIEEAKTVLEFGISCKTDVRTHYILLANIYKEEFHPEKIDSLIETADSLNSLMRNPIITALQEIRERLS